MFIHRLMNEFVIIDTENLRYIGLRLGNKTLDSLQQVRRIALDEYLH